MNETVGQVIPVIRENRRKFEEFCFSLSEEELVRPVPGSAWIVRDFASHLATLDTLFDGFVTTVERGGQINMTQDANGAPFDLDAWNDVQVAERRSWTVRQIFDEAAANREELIAALGRLDEEQVARSMHFSDPKRGSADFPLKAFLVGWAQHDPMHVADMLKALPGRAGDAGLTSWLANPFVSGYQASMSGMAKG
jgi:Mycothiol maleylpyruvate isomerase N-terminal domain